jgi:AcrR family transcriptional regulator
MDETRARILDAAVELYETVGPAATSMSAVAERAGVTRATVYRHFRTDSDLANAVIDEWDPGATGLTDAAAAATDPAARLRVALAQLYGRYRATEAMTRNLLRDSHALPVERRPDLRASARTVREVVGHAGFGGPGSSTAAAALGHAVAFETWSSLSGEGLDDDAIVELMVRLVGFNEPSSRSTARASSRAVAPRETTQSSDAGARDARVAKEAASPKAAKPPKGPKAPKAPKAARAPKAPKEPKAQKGKAGKKAKADRKARERRPADG